jgi:hypothetical protein
MLFIPSQGSHSIHFFLSDIEALTTDPGEYGLFSKICMFYSLY